MNTRGSRDADEGYGAGDDWDMFGDRVLGDLAGLIGDGGDAQYMREADYTAAVRQAKICEREVLRALGDVLPPGVRVFTQAWSTPEGEPVVLVEISVDVWCRWAKRAEGVWHWWYGSRRDPVALGHAVRANRRSRGLIPEPGRGAAGASARRSFWFRCPASVMVELVSAYQRGK
jgi:hypothetical protein